eukprot:m.504939 g.504939  ORF g.504939 m.504939 type:complete len:107 (-) comp21863_c0_seq19:3260-3580(-)
MTGIGLVRVGAQVLVFSSLIVGFLVAFSPFVRRFMLAAQFVFVRRPYHIGDTVRITQDGTGRTMIVKAISLMDTTFVMIFGGGNLVWDNSVRCDCPICKQCSCAVL